MALLVKERKALERLETSFQRYFKHFYKEAEIDTSKTPEERILHLAMLLDTVV